ncbi:MAG: hypothetical protein KC435_14710 [Thermomicrobiales bacterium]|nr:hypothetical protein [Thermomicrobiales bacterium]
MRRLRWVSVMFTTLLVLGLAACGSDDKAEPTATAVATIAPTTKPAEVVTAVPTESVATPVGLVATPVSAVSTAEIASVPVVGTLTLGGTENKDYIVTATGCVGLGEWSALQSGAQVIVRDANGTVVDIAELVAATGDGCSWTFDIDAPGSAFVSVSVPMLLEQWFTAAQIQSGMIEIALP